MYLILLYFRKKDIKWWWWTKCYCHHTSSQTSNTQHTSYHPKKSECIDFWVHNWKCAAFFISRECPILLDDQRNQWGKGTHVQENTDVALWKTISENEGDRYQNPSGCTMADIRTGHHWSFTGVTGWTQRHLIKFATLACERITDNATPMMSLLPK